MWKNRNIIDRLDTSIEEKICKFSMIVIKIWISISNLFEDSTTYNKKTEQQDSKSNENRNSKINNNNWISVLIIIISTLIPNSTFSINIIPPTSQTFSNNQSNSWEDIIIWQEDYSNIVSKYHELLNDWKKVLSDIQNDTQKTTQAALALEIDNLRISIRNSGLERENRMLRKIYKRLIKFIENIRDSDNKSLLACESISPESLTQFRKDVEYLKSLNNPKYNYIISILETVCWNYYVY